MKAWPHDRMGKQQSLQAATKINTYVYKCKTRPAKGQGKSKTRGQQISKRSPNTAEPNRKPELGEVSQVA